MKTRMAEGATHASLYHSVVSDIGQCMSEFSQRISKEVIDHILRFTEEGLRDANAFRADDFF